MADVNITITQDDATTEILESATAAIKAVADEAIDGGGESVEAITDEDEDEDETEWLQARLELMDANLTMMQTTLQTMSEAMTVLAATQLERVSLSTLPPEPQQMPLTDAPPPEESESVPSPQELLPEVLPEVPPEVAAEKARPKFRRM